MPDPRPAEKLLRKLPGVVEARVWVKGEALLANVVVFAESRLTGADLQHACLEKLGVEGAPRLVLLSRADKALKTG